jgi:hypothetical protein
MRRRTLIEPGYKTKVTRAALKGLPEIGVLTGISVHDRAITEDNLKVGNIVRGKALSERMEGVLEKKSVAHLHECRRNSNIRRLQW